MPPPIYLDYNATTPADPRVVERMLPYFTGAFGNPSSKGHAYGWAAAEAVDVAREAVAALLDAAPEEIVFTSGATEALNLALKGVARTYARKGRHVVTVRTEHSAVLDTCRALERDGVRVSYLDVGADGRVDPARFGEALGDDTILAAVMWANNETGVLQPIPALYEIARARGVLFLTDATQAVGKVPVSTSHADLLVLSAHKFYGPKGVGALYASRRDPRVRLGALLSGGGQEGGLRGGTLNVPGIVGLGAAADLARAETATDGARLSALRDRFEDAVLEAVPGASVNGAGAPRLPQTSNITFAGRRAADLILALRGLAVSAGSACASGSGRPSHVLKAMGLSDEDALGALRFSLGRPTTAEDVDAAVEQVAAAARTAAPAAG